MAKDPAMLWYWADWHSGTIILSRFLKGCYMDILHAQFNSGRLSLEEIRTVLGSDFGQAWPTLQKKFAVDETGKYFNVRLEQEKIKRANFTNSRRRNLESTHMEPHMASHMDSHMENRNVNKNLNEIKKKKESEILTPKTLVWDDELYQPVLERIAKAYRVSNMQDALDLWEGWYMNKFEWRKKDLQEMRKSFESWLKDPKSADKNGKPHVTLEELSKYRTDV